MTRQTMVNTEAAGIKFYLNGFPKAGLHLLDLLIRPLALPMADDQLWNAPWVGMFKGHSWTNERHDLEPICYRLGRAQPGRFLKGHLGHDHDLANFMYHLGLVHIFIYRDLRDVAVSQVFHILDSQQRGGKQLFGHPGKASYLTLGGFDEILTAVIGGHEKYPGILERWLEYFLWIDAAGAQERVLCLRYEDIMEDPIITSMDIIQYMIRRLKETTGQAPLNLPVMGIAEQMWESAQRTELSPTFREGRVGGWRRDFKPFHIAQFQALDTTQFISRLDYEW